MNYLRLRNFKVKKLPQGFAWKQMINWELNFQNIWEINT